MRLSLLLIYLTYYANIFGHGHDILTNYNYDNFENQFALEKQIFIAENALELGLFNSAAEIYNDIIDNYQIKELGNFKGTNISSDEIYFSLIKSLIGKRDFIKASLVIENISDSNRGDSYWLYSLLINHFTKHDVTKKDSIYNIKSGLKNIDPKNLTNAEKAWYYYLVSSVDLLENKKISKKDPLFMALEFSDENPYQEAFFESLILRLEYNADETEQSTLKRLEKLLKSKDKKRESYFYAYDYAYLLALKGDKDYAIDVINKQLSKGLQIHNNFELDNLRILKVVVLGPESIAGRDLLFRLIQSSKDELILSKCFYLLERYLYNTNDTDFIQTLSEYFESQRNHSLRARYFLLKANMTFRSVSQYSQLIGKEDKNKALNQLEYDAYFILDNFPATQSLNDVYHMLAYVALNQEQPQYRLAADYLIKILDFKNNDLDKFKFNKIIGDFYFLNGDYLVAVDFYKDALSYKNLLNPEERGKLWFRLITSQMRGDGLEHEIHNQLKNEAYKGVIPFDYFLMIQWNYSLLLKDSGDFESAIKEVENILDSDFLDLCPISWKLRFNWLSLYLKNKFGLVEYSLVNDSNDLISACISSDDKFYKSDERILLHSQAILLKSQFLLKLDMPNEAFYEIDLLQNDFPETQASELSYIILANYYANQGEFSLAESVLIELAENYPQSEYAPQALLEAAINLGKLGSDKYRQAIELINQLVRNYSESSIVFFALRHQGDLLRRSSDFSAALSVYDSLIQKFPDHENRYLVELSRLDCLLALADDQTNYHFKEIIFELERLLDLPNLPQAFRYEVIYKLAFSLYKSENKDSSRDVILSELNIVLNQEIETGLLHEIDRYWISRSFFLLTDMITDKNIEEKKKIYRIIISYNLPGSELAQQLLRDL